MSSKELRIQCKNCDCNKHVDNLNHALEEGKSNLAINLIKYKICNKTIKSGTTFASTRNLTCRPFISLAIQYWYRHSRPLKVISLLIDKGANINARDFVYETPFQLAVAVGNEDIVKLLIMHKAIIDRFHNDGITPLIYCIIYNKPAIAKLLIQNGAFKPNLLTKQAPLHYASDFNRPKIAKMLIEWFHDIDAKDNQMKTALHLAVMGENNKIILMLLKAGADVTIQDSDLKTALHYAAKNGSIKAIENLMDYQANIKVADRLGQSPICIAFKNGEIEAVRVLAMKHLKKKCFNMQPIMFNPALYQFAKMAVSKY